MKEYPGPTVVANSTWYLSSGRRSRSRPIGAACSGTGVNNDDDSDEEYFDSDDDDDYRLKIL